MSQPTDTHEPRVNVTKGTTALALASVILIAMCLRPAATSLGPVLEEIQQAFDLHGWQTGFLTALPGLSFVVFGAVAVLVLRRLGMFGALLLSNALIAAGTLARVLVSDFWAFSLFTVMALAGMAMGNVLLPVFVKSRFVGSQAFGATIFTVFLGLGTTLPAFFTAPIAEHFGGWRVGLGIWVVFPLCALVAWILLRAVKSIPAVSTSSTNAAGVKGPSIMRSRKAWLLTGYFGLQSMHAYVQFGWLPQIYRDAGLSSIAAGNMITIVAAGGILGGFLAPQFVVRGHFTRTILMTYAAFSIAGYLGLLLAPTTVPWLWAVLFSIGGFSFPSALALITSRTRSVAVTARASGFVQPAGYVLAAAGPLAVGALNSALGGWDVVLVGLMIAAGVMGVMGVLAASPSTIDEDLRRFAARRGASDAPTDREVV